jgi:hypothetical protein
MEEPTKSAPSGTLYLRGRHTLTSLLSAQGEPASTSHDLCFTHRCLNHPSRFSFQFGRGFVRPVEPFGMEEDLVVALG